MKVGIPLPDPERIRPDKVRGPVGDPTKSSKIWTLHIQLVNNSITTDVATASTGVGLLRVDISIPLLPEDIPEIYRDPTSLRELIYFADRPHCRG